MVSRPRVAVVTGGARGIGRAIVERFCHDGALVALWDVDADAARKTADDLCPQRVTVIPCDVTDAAAVDAAARLTHRTFGRIDVLVNNAVGWPGGDVMTMTMERFDRDIDESLRAPVLCLRTVTALMADHGAVVNIGSVNAFGYLGNDAYSAAKAAMVSITNSAAIRLAPRGIRVNTVAPGTVATQHWAKRASADPGLRDRVAAWYPLGRIGAPSDVAAAVTFLASSEASWITGVTLRVDGGLGAGLPAMVRDLRLDPGRD